MASEYKDKTVSDLTGLLAEKRKAFANFRFAIAGSKTRNTKEGKGLRREIARIQTELAKREGNKAR